jgi:hypothetical protein
LIVKNLANWSWLELNAWLKEATEQQVAKALKEERKRKPRRAQFVKRIHSRLNKLRAERERRELEK